MTSLVTGADGFIGSFLCEHLKSRGDQVIAAGRENGDVMNRAALQKLVGESKPDRVFHLAAQSLPRQSWENPALTFRVNVEGTLNVLDAVRGAQLDPLIAVACSSSEYGPSDKPIREDDALQPASPYAVSKLGADHAARLYGQRYSMRVIRMRPFFLIGPRKTGDVASDFARRIVSIERGKSKELPVGRLDVVRDFLDIRDGVEAMDVITQRGRAGEAYNISSGTGSRILDLLEQFKRQALVNVEERIEPFLMRSLDEMAKVGDSSKLRALGWTPEHTLGESVAAILEYWRCKS